MEIARFVGQLNPTPAVGEPRPNAPAISAFAQGATLALAAAIGLGAALLTGCGTPASPQPPSLNLPLPVQDLAVERVGDTITLRWTNPRKNTDKLLLKGELTVRICPFDGGISQVEGAKVAPPGSCVPSAELRLAPGAKGVFTGQLDAALASGPPRAISYFVELPNRHGRSAGLSNPAIVVGGQAPPAISGLTAGLEPQGVALHWTPPTGPLTGTASAHLAVRIHRTLLSPAPGGAQPTGIRSSRSPLAATPEPAEQSLIVEQPVGPDAHPKNYPDTATGETENSFAGLGGALDQTAETGRTYLYTVQPVIRFPLPPQTPAAAATPPGVAHQDTSRAGDGDEKSRPRKSGAGRSSRSPAANRNAATPDAPTLELALELDGALSAPIRIEVKDIFPPSIPQNLAAVAVAAQTEPSVPPASIDLSWTPSRSLANPPNLAGYIVYRREGAGAWQRVSPKEPVPAPAWRDSQVLPGHTYTYAVSAISQSGNESRRGASATETVPQP